MRVVVGWEGSERNAASTSEMGRFETELLTQKENLKGLERLNVEWVNGAIHHRGDVYRHDRGILRFSVRALATSLPGLALGAKNPKLRSPGRAHA